MDKCRAAFESVFPEKSVFVYIEYDAKFNIYGSKDDLSGEEPIGLFTAIANLNGAWWAWQYKQAELDQQKLLTLDSELHLDAAKEEIERLRGVVDKALSLINNWWHPNVDQKLFIEDVSKALKGKDQYTEHRSKAEQQINKGARLTKHQIDLGANNANS